MHKIHRFFIKQQQPVDIQICFYFVNNLYVLHTFFRKKCVVFMRDKAVIIFLCNQMKWKPEQQYTVFLVT